MKSLNVKEREGLIEKQNNKLSIRRQCELLSVNRSSLYYISKEFNTDNSLNNIISTLHHKFPFYGHRRVCKYLNDRLGIDVNIKKVIRIRKDLNIRTIYPAPNTSKPKKMHKKYPYLLQNLKIEKKNQVFSTDITYIRVKNKGWIYLVAVIDWYSRYILSYEISISMENDFCIEALKKALSIGKPEIFNTDQGSQFTSNEFLKVLETEKIKISMDSKGRALDNIICERFWRSTKYEDVYLNEYNTVQEARVAIDDYIKFYNKERIHQSLDYYTPEEVYFQKEKVFDPSNIKNNS